MNNLIYSNMAHGIFNSGAERSLIYNNRIWGTTSGDGIYAINSATNTFMANTVFSNIHPAIFLS
jgi:nitrous oxidase accessory protein NosD